MKSLIITVRVPDFCPEDCRELDCISDTIDYRGMDGVVWTDKKYRCEHEERCMRLYKHLKARGEDAGMENRPAEQDGLV